MKRHGDQNLTFDLISKDKIKMDLKTQIIADQIYAFWSIRSTNEFAYRLARQGEPEGTLVIAEEQTGGKGRLDRKWESLFGKGLWFSIILRPPVVAARAGLFPFLAGVSIAEAVENKLELQPQVKWPNDLMINGKKFCGILSEAEFSRGKVEFIILGIGINVNHTIEDFSEDIRDQAVSLQMALQRPADRLPLLVEALNRIEANYLLMQRKGFGAIIRRWKKRCQNWGKPIKLVQGTTTLEGIFEGLAEDGSLLLRLDDGHIKKILAGDIYQK
ncbi:MAG: biotin--[acetyl-CoA-carboxylase] ligase [candidate division KSB1 bacterium]|nr:biotin--[acetyl-CoA-carboxylase] ligase [candidate division KSB1 bacterium]